jgi:hypothetical protein
VINSSGSAQAYVRRADAIDLRVKRRSGAAQTWLRLAVSRLLYKLRSKKQEQETPGKPVRHFRGHERQQFAQYFSVSGFEEIAGQAQAGVERSKKHAHISGQQSQHYQGHGIFLQAAFRDDSYKYGKAGSHIPDHYAGKQAASHGQQNEQRKNDRLVAAYVAHIRDQAGCANDVLEYENGVHQQKELEEIPVEKNTD